MPEPLAFWDIDGTLVSQSLERHFLRYLIAHGHVTERRVGLNLLNLAFRFPWPPWYQMKLAYLRNKSEADVNSWIEACWRDVIQRELCTEAVAEFTRQKTSGYRQVLLSGTPRQLAEPLAAHLGTRDLIAAVPEIISGRYTGRLVEPHPHGTLKVDYAEEWCLEHDLELSQAAAYGNHWGDRHLLQRVATPVAVNPDPQLANFAAEKGWRVIRGDACPS